MLFFPFDRWGNWALEKIGNLSYHKTPPADPGVLSIALLLTLVCVTLYNCSSTSWVSVVRLD